MSKISIHSRPEVQARRIADMSNPEYMRRRAMVKAATGYKRERLVKWNIAWNLSGRARDFPDFPEWDAANKPAMDAERAKQRAYQKRLNVWHAAWVAAGMPSGFPNMQTWEASQ